MPLPANDLAADSMTSNTGGGRRSGGRTVLRWFSYQRNGSVSASAPGRTQKDHARTRSRARHGHRLLVAFPTLVFRSACLQTVPRAAFRDQVQRVVGFSHISAPRSPSVPVRKKKSLFVYSVYHRSRSMTRDSLWWGCPLFHVSTGTHDLFGKFQCDANCFPCHFQRF